MTDDISKLGIDNPEDRTVLYTYDELDRVQGRSFTLGQSSGRDSMRSEVLRLIQDQIASRMKISASGRPEIPDSEYPRIVGTLITELEKSKK